MQILDWALLALILLAAALSVRKIIRDRRAGKCCCNCAGCTANCSAACAAHGSAARTAHSEATCAAHSDAAGAAHRAQNTSDRAG